MGECIQLAISTDVKQAAGSIVGTSSKSVTVREEAENRMWSVHRRCLSYQRYVPDSIDVGFVTSEGLRGTTSPDIPQLSCGITSARNKNILVGSERKALKGRGQISETDTKTKQGTS